MKILKSLMLLMMATCAITFSSCGGDGDDDSGSGGTTSVVVNPMTMSFDAAGGTQTFTVNSASPYVKSNADWLTVSKSSSTTTNAIYTVTCASQTAETERTGTILVNVNGTAVNISVTQTGKAKEEQKDYTFGTANEVAKKMYPGWNLGNTMEGCNSAYNFTNNGGVGCETSWQSTKTTQAIIDAVRDAGFKSVRIPVAWVAGHVTGTELNPELDAAWVARVKEIVDYCINDGLYVVMNDHWDGGWLEVLGFSQSTSSYLAVSDSYVDDKMVTLKHLWTAIANEFKNYDEHLIFAGLNEPFQEYSLFSTRHETLTPILIKYNKAFVEAVRATGGNNANRILVVQGPSVNIDSSVKYMASTTLPETSGKLMVEVHYYDPGQFCGTYDNTADNANSVWFWGSGNHSTSAGHNATWGEESTMKSQFEKLKTTYTSKGYPVIIGEYAGSQRTLASAYSSEQSKHDASVKAFYKYVNQYATERGIVAFAWDTNDVTGLSKPDGSTTIIDRANAKVVGTNAMAGILEGCKAATWPY